MRIFTIGFTFAALAASVARPADLALETCPGRGYFSYGFPSFDSCPCGADGCFHPRRYYACGGDADPDYKQAFWRRWLRAHFCGGSMLDGIPCYCISPPGQTVLTTDTPVPALVLPPQPADKLQDQNETPEAAALESDPTTAGEPSPFRLKRNPS